MNANYPRDHFIDCHCHILPGLDDGARSLRETRRLLELACAEGIDTMIATPHFRPGVWEASREQYLRALAAAREVARELDPAFRILPGNELFCEEGFMYHLAAGACLPLPNRFVLLEFPYHTKLDSMMRAFESLQWNDYHPILAHAERYTCLIGHMGHVAALRRQGVLIQVNTDSLTGENGWGTRLFTHGLLRAEQIDLLGTDCHNTNTRPPRYRKCAKYVRQHCSLAYGRRLLYENPEHLIASR